MKNFVILIAFVSTTLCGLVISDSINFSFNPNNFLDRDYVCRMDAENKERFFTLQESDLLSGKKVISRNTSFRTNEIGRIVSFEMVSPEKFIIEIYWGNGALDENSRVTFHDKVSFSRDFEIID